MLKPFLKIIIFDGSFNTTSFINRLAKGLAVKNDIFILGFNEKLSKKIEGINYVAIGSNQNKLRFVFTTLGWIFRSGAFQLLLPTLIKIIRGNRQVIQQQNLDFALKTISPDLIHLQWPSVMPWFEQLLLEQKTPVVLSQRGFHSNVRPFVDKVNFEYLKKWYPKMAGFHSVSKMISANGDRMWNSLEKIDEVVYTGLTFDNLPFCSQYKISKPIKLLSVGRAHWIKGYDDALQNCKLLKERHIPFHYTIIGGAEDEELQFLINDLGLQEFVSLEKRMSQEKVFKLMGEASLLLMPSLEEGIPNVVVEAMAIGLPVLSTDCGGVPELITNGREGWVVPLRNPTAMADAIEAFTTLSMEKIEEVRIAARRKVELQHSETQMLMGMEKLYREVL